MELLGHNGNSVCNFLRNCACPEVCVSLLGGAGSVFWSGVQRQGFLTSAQVSHRVQARLGSPDLLAKKCMLDSKPILPDRGEGSVRQGRGLPQSAGCQHHHPMLSLLIPPGPSCKRQTTLSTTHLASLTLLLSELDQHLVSGSEEESLETSVLLHPNRPTELNSRSSARCSQGSQS